jgi:hypothetical protein
MGSKARAEVNPWATAGHGHRGETADLEQLGSPDRADSTAVDEGRSTPLPSE